MTERARQVLKATNKRADAKLTAWLTLFNDNGYVDLEY